ncbi:putative Secreted Protein [Cryptosporidium felis]|nr:putative Secreted Protein [Cryptosporidium felis]
MNVGGFEGGNNGNIEDLERQNRNDGGYINDSFGDADTPGANFLGIDDKGYMGNGDLFGQKTGEYDDFAGVEANKMKDPFDNIGSSLGTIEENNSLKTLDGNDLNKIDDYNGDEIAQIDKIINKNVADGIDPIDSSNIPKDLEEIVKPSNGEDYMNFEDFSDLNSGSQLGGISNFSGIVENDGFGDEKFDELEIEKGSDAILNEVFHNIDYFGVDNGGLEGIVSNETDEFSEIPGQGIQILPEGLGQQLEKPNVKSDILEDLENFQDEDEFENEIAFLERQMENKDSNVDNDFMSTVDSEELSDMEEIHELNLILDSLGDGDVNNYVNDDEEMKFIDDLIQEVEPKNTIETSLITTPEQKYGGNEENVELNINQEDLSLMNDQIDDIIKDIENQMAATSSEEDTPNGDITQSSTLGTEYKSNEDTLNLVTGQDLDFTSGGIRGGNGQTDFQDFAILDQNLQVNDIQNQDIENELGLDTLFNSGSLKNKDDQNDDDLLFINKMAKDSDLVNEDLKNKDDLEIAKDIISNLSINFKNEEEDASDDDAAMGEYLGSLFEQPEYQTSINEREFLPENSILGEKYPKIVDSLPTGIINEGFQEGPIDLDDLIVLDGGEASETEDSFDISTLFEEFDVNKKETKGTENLINSDFGRLTPDQNEKFNENDDNDLDLSWLYQTAQDGDANNLFPKTQVGGLSSHVPKNNYELDLGDLDFLNEDSYQTRENGASEHIKDSKNTPEVEDIYHDFLILTKEMESESEDTDIPNGSTEEETDFRLDDFFESEVNQVKLNAANKQKINSDEADPLIEGIYKTEETKVSKRKNNSSEQFDISAEDFDSLFKSVEQDDPADTKDDDTFEEDFLEFENFLAPGGDNHKLSRAIRAESSESIQPHPDDFSRSGKTTESPVNDHSIIQGKRLRGSLDNGKGPNYLGKERSNGTIFEKRREDSEKEWILSFAPKLKPGRMQRRRDLFTQEEIDQAIEEAKMA